MNAPHTASQKGFRHASSRSGVKDKEGRHWLLLRKYKTPKQWVVLRYCSTHMVLAEIKPSIRRDRYPKAVGSQCYALTEKPPVPHLIHSDSGFETCVRPDTDLKLNPPLSPTSASWLVHAHEVSGTHKKDPAISRSAVSLLPSCLKVKETLCGRDAFHTVLLHCFQAAHLDLICPSIV